MNYRLTFTILGTLMTVIVHTPETHEKQGFPSGVTSNHVTSHT